MVENSQPWHKEMIQSMPEPPKKMIRSMPECLKSKATNIQTVIVKTEAYNVVICTKHMQH